MEVKNGHVLDRALGSGEFSKVFMLCGGVSNSVRSLLSIRESFGMFRATQASGVVERCVKHI